MLSKIQDKLYQASAVAFYLEGAAETAGEDMTAEDHTRLVSSAYLLSDLLRDIQNLLDEAEGHAAVCDAIRTVNHVKDLQAEIAELKAAANL